MPFCHLTLRADKPPGAGYPRELKTLGNYIRKRRLDLGLLQREVAVLLGVTADTVRHWERGKTAPQGRFRSAVVRFLGAQMP